MNRVYIVDLGHFLRSACITLLSLCAHFLNDGLLQVLDFSFLVSLSFTRLTMSNSWNGKTLPFSLTDPYLCIIETLFGCFNDMGSCLYGFCCLPCLFGTNAEKVDGTTCVGMCCAYMLLTECYLCGLPHYVTRKKLREKFNLEEDEQCNDILTVIFCSPCGICQEARELKSRGTFFKYG